MAALKTKLIVKINPIPDLDLGELEQLTRKLQQELLELDIESAEFATTGEELTGTKAGKRIKWGTIIVALLAADGVATKLVDLSQAWLTYNQQQSIILEIDGDKLEVKGISSEEQQKLIDMWIERHSKKNTTD